VDEALSLNPDIISTACPFCLVMLTDSVNGKKATAESGSAAGVKVKQSIQVVDVAQLLLDSLKTPPSDPAPETESEGAPEPEPVK
ncbi:Fe-S oxidoreductase, partial [Streptomyces werraensis]